MDDLLIYKSLYWSWFLLPNQVTLGSSYLILNRKCSLLTDLTEDECDDLTHISGLIQNVLKKVFNCNNISIFSLNNYQYNFGFYFIPRYLESFNMFDLEWKDLDNSLIPNFNLLSSKNIKMNKIIEFIKTKLPKIDNKIIGYTTGVYDLFHIGHLNILKRAKEKCDYLIVGISTDELVLNYKNKIPIISFEERMEIVKSIKFVDKVVPQNTKDKFQAWKSLKFNKMFVGSDWKGSQDWINIENDFKNTNVEIVYLPHTDGISSTILKEYLYKKI